jgi:hypothetical protein
MANWVHGLKLVYPEKPLSINFDNVRSFVRSDNDPGITDIYYPNGSKIPVLHRYEEVLAMVRGCDHPDKG